MSSSRIHLGVSLPVQSFNYMAETAITAEKVGFDSVWYQDHLVKTYRESWTVLASLAVMTKKVRLGPLVTCALYRRPALLAKIVSTLDEISNGRVNLGIGAGWWEREFLAYGVPFDPPRIRVEKTRECIEIMKALWTSEERIDYKGKYYTIIGGELKPKPVQKPYPPIFLGAMKPMMLKLTAKYGDGWIPDLGDVDKYKEALNIIYKHLERDKEDFKAGIVLKGCFAKNYEEAKSRYGEMLLKRFKVSSLDEIDEIISSSKGRYFIGGTDEIAKVIERFRNAGATYYVFLFEPNEEALSMVKGFSETIRYLKETFT